MEFPQCVPILYQNEYYSLYVEYPYLYISDLASRGVKLEVSETVAVIEDTETYTVRLSNEKKQYRIQSYFKHELHSVLVYYNILQEYASVESPTEFVCVLKEYITEAKIYKNVYQIVAQLGQSLVLRGSNTFLEFPYTAVDKIMEPDVDSIKFTFEGADIILQFSNRQLLNQFLQFLQGETVLAREIYNELKTGSHLIKTPNKQLHNQITNIDLTTLDAIYEPVVGDEMEQVRGKIEKLGRLAALKQYEVASQEIIKPFDTEHAGERAHYKTTDKSYVDHLCKMLVNEESGEKPEIGQEETSGSEEFDDLGNDMREKEIEHREECVDRDKELERLNIGSVSPLEYPYENAKRALSTAIDAIRKTAQPTERELLELQNLKSIAAEFGRVPEKRLVEEIYETLENFADEIPDDYNAIGSDNSEINPQSVNLGDYASREEELEEEIARFTHKITVYEEKLLKLENPEKRQKINNAIAELKEKLAFSEEQLSELQQIQIEQTSSESILGFAKNILEIWNSHEHNSPLSSDILEQIGTFREFLGKLTKSQHEELYELLDSRNMELEDLTNEMDIEKNMYNKLKATDDLQAEEHIEKYKELRRLEVRLKSQVEEHEMCIEFIESVMSGLGNEELSVKQESEAPVTFSREDICTANRELLETPRLVALFVAGNFIRCQLNCEVSGGIITYALTEEGAGSCCSAQFATEFVLTHAIFDLPKINDTSEEIGALIAQYHKMGEEEFEKRLMATKPTELNRKKLSERIDGYYFRTPVILEGDTAPHTLLLDKDNGTDLEKALISWCDCDK